MRPDADQPRTWCEFAKCQPWDTNPPDGAWLWKDENHDGSLQMEKDAKKRKTTNRRGKKIKKKKKFRSGGARRSCSCSTSPSSPKETIWDSNSRKAESNLGKTWIVRQDAFKFPLIWVNFLNISLKSKTFLPFVNHEIEICTRRCCCFIKKESYTNFFWDFQYLQILNNTIDSRGCHSDIRDYFQLWTQTFLELWSLNCFCEFGAL